jgi:hypothetical protein
MFDIFYLNEKPNVALHERKAESIEDARVLSRTRYFWLITYLADFSGWDWLWEPAPWQAQQRHAWPSQWQPDAGIYLVPKTGFDCTNYHDSPRLDVVKNSQFYDNFELVFDYTWHPNPSEPVYICQFGTQWQKTGGPRYSPPGATDIKYIESPRAVCTTIDSHWNSNKFVDFDYTWHPDDTDEPYIYQFGTQWQKTGGPRYVEPGATLVKYVTSPRVIRTDIDSCWEVPDDIEFVDFDYTWHPDDTDEPYIYQFGTQWQKTGGPRYVVPGATVVKYVEFPRASRSTIDSNWEIPVDIVVDDFDYTWHPDDTDEPYIYQFGTQWQKTGGPRYVVPGATVVKYVDSIRAKRAVVDSNWEIPVGIDLKEFDYTWNPDTTNEPYIYQFGTQWQKTGGPRYVVPGATTVKYVHSPRAIRVQVDDNWELPPDGEFGNFDYTWHPDDTDEPYIYQFGTQWQKTGGPKYIVPGATVVKYIEQVKIESKRVAGHVFLLDHLDGNMPAVKKQLETMFETVKVVRYFDNYLDTLKRIAKSCQDITGFVWVCSSVCDYADFDFSWHPEVWQTGMLHVFASNEQQFGDTFFMHPDSFSYRSESCQLLDWYDVNYVSNLSVPRHALPVVNHNYDTHVEAVQTMDWTGPLAIFTTGIVPDSIPTVSLWREKTKTVVPLSLGASSVVVPKTAVPYIKTQIYDYPYIDRAHRSTTNDSLLDIVFISNGEVNAIYNWEWLKVSCQSNTHRPEANRLVRSDRVNGREAAYRAAAELSNTPWFFAVFAKLEPSLDFDWSWQPDRLQQPKHYIFHAHNPVTGLEYGHMAVIAYNKQLVLENTAPGLDFTLDQEHEVVPMLSGQARYHDNAWMCWRTAFRECIKLQHSLPDVESQYRLQCWLNNNLLGNEMGEWSRHGAADAVEYYNSVAGDFAELRKSYDWAWLASYAFMRRNLTPDQ